MRVVWYPGPKALPRLIERIAQVSGRHWSPYQIEIILHHYCSPAPYQAANEQMYQKELDSMLARGILRPDDKGIWRPTDIGRALVELWLQTPLPRQVIIDPRTKQEIGSPDLWVYMDKPTDIREPRPTRTQDRWEEGGNTA